MNKLDNINEITKNKKVSCVSLTCFEGHSKTGFQKSVSNSHIYGQHYTERILFRYTRVWVFIEKPVLLHFIIVFGGYMYNYAMCVIFIMSSVSHVF